jgi:hypothetical protein
MSDLHGDPPSGTRNGASANPVAEAEATDHRVVYAVVSGIVLAFLLGFILLVVSAMADWVD